MNYCDELLLLIIVIVVHSDGSAAGHALLEQFGGLHSIAVVVAFVVLGVGSTAAGADCWPSETRTHQ